jgi:hypothetical protein
MKPVMPTLRRFTARYSGPGGPEVMFAIVSTNFVDAMKEAVRRMAYVPWATKLEIEGR